MFNIKLDENISFNYICQNIRISVTTLDAFGQLSGWKTFLTLMSLCWGTSFLKTCYSVYQRLFISSLVVRLPRKGRHQGKIMGDITADVSFHYSFKFTPHVVSLLLNSTPLVHLSLWTVMDRKASKLEHRRDIVVWKLLVLINSLADILCSFSAITQ